VSDIDFQKIVDQAKGTVALGRLDPIQLGQNEQIDPEQMLRLQRLVNATYLFMRQLAEVTGNMPEVCNAVTIAVAVAVATRCPEDLREQFVEALCETLRSGSQNTQLSEDDQ
jgi:hypothetical protein